MKFILTLTAILILSVQTKASHLMGGEITWECSNGNYIFTLKIYRDCSPVSAAFTTATQTINVVGHPAINTMNATFYALSDLSSQGCGYDCDDPNLPPTPTPGGFGSAQEFVFKTAPIDLGSYVPPTTGWLFYWSTCCRNTNQNLTTQNAGIGIRSKMFSFNGQPASPCYDNSPAFAERPNVAICSGYSFTYNNTTMDNDLDSIHYAWDMPMSDNGITLLNYQSPYSTTNQLPGNPLLNEFTGEVTINPAVGTQGNFATCIRVEAYKCNVKVAEIFREIQVGLSANCSPVFGGGINSPPSIRDAITTLPITNYVDTVYVGDSVSLGLQIQDFDYNPNPFSLQQVTVTANSPQLGTNDTSTTGCLTPPCATLDHTTPYTFPGFGTLSFNWVPGCGHVSVQNGCIQSKSVHQFVINVKDNYCPVPAQNNVVITVVVLGPQLTESNDTLYVQFPNATGYQWYLNGNPIPGATNSYYAALTSGVYSVEATTGSCSLMSAPRNMSIDCNFTPTITGNLMLCPNQTDTLYTQQYDSYQWYKKPIGGSASPIPGATSQTLAIDAFNDAGYYFSVEATDDSCTEMSAEVLVDGWVFLLPTVMSTGDFTTGPNGEAIVCAGDTMYLELMQPYTTNITWYNNGTPIPGATSQILTVYTTGNYTCQGAPQICPNFIQQLGVTIEVQVIVCTDIDEIENDVNIYPNPADQYLYINTGDQSSGISSIVVSDLAGKTMLEVNEIKSKKINLPLASIKEGIYIVKIVQHDQTEVSRKIIVK